MWFGDLIFLGFYFLILMGLSLYGVHRYVILGLYYWRFNPPVAESLQTFPSKPEKRWGFDHVALGVLLPMKAGSPRRRSPRNDRYGRLRACPDTTNRAGYDFRLAVRFREYKEEVS